MRYLCKGGTCGVCKGRLIEGKVHLERNFALTNDELNEGHILLCQSYPLNNEVTVVVD
jgi:ring-1,2-phenylacetyl-CoA epoxidase subunit PaaE